MFYCLPFSIEKKGGAALVFFDFDKKRRLPGDGEAGEERSRAAEAMDGEYLEGEELKSEGWRSAQPRPVLDQRSEGSLKLIEAHYRRSVEAWRLRRGHGSFSEFLASWLMGERVQTDSLFAEVQPVLEALRRKFPAPEKPRIGEGMSYWGTGEDHQQRNKYNSLPRSGRASLPAARFQPGPREPAAVQA
jgi:hypothetical protein